MATISLDDHFEKFVRDQIASGRYGTANEVVEDALRLMEDRERRLAAFDSAIEEGLADVAAGRIHDAELVFDEIEEELTKLSDFAAE